MKKIITLLAVTMLAVTLQAAPKKLLVVSTTMGFRHSSIPTLEKMLTELSKDSGEFTVDFVEQPPGHAPSGFPKKLKDNATPEEKAAFDESEAKWNEALKVTLQKLSPNNLKNYDGVVFVSTTGYGPLPLPDAPGFFKWLKAGHAFIGLHAASDIHGWPEYTDMIGGEFLHHGKQVAVECLNQDPANPATAAVPKAWTIQQEEIYQFTNYSPEKVHDLLILDKHPETGAAGHYGVSWCKDYGKGKVFYTSLGHREDLIDGDPTLKDRKNSADISKVYRAHVLGGIEWALGLKK